MFEKAKVNIITIKAEVGLKHGDKVVVNNSPLRA